MLTDPRNLIPNSALKGYRPNPPPEQSSTVPLLRLELNQFQPHKNQGPSNYVGSYELKVNLAQNVIEPPNAFAKLLDKYWINAISQEYVQS